MKWNTQTVVIALVALVIVWHLLRAQTPEFDPANMTPGTGPVTPSIRAMILRGQWNAR